MVTGGSDGSNRLDSTELLRPGSSWKEISSARLPRPMLGVRVTNVDNRVFLFGEWRHMLILLLHLPYTDTVTGGYDGVSNEDILEYNDNDGWRELGTMKNGRYYHGISLADYCNWYGMVWFISE